MWWSDLQVFFDSNNLVLQIFSL
uniref:Uncharacterized protein n=1 Tax=Arundo donax TaxID=35708 RepID=A0A0A8ZTX1_ARUDO